MPKKAEKEEVKKAIADFIEAEGVKSTREIADGVADTIGFTPSSATVAEVLRDLGYSPRKWFWEK